MTGAAAQHCGVGGRGESAVDAWFREEVGGSTGLVRERQGQQPRSRPRRGGVGGGGGGIVWEEGGRSPAGLARGDLPLKPRLREGGEP